MGDSPIAFGTIRVVTEDVEVAGVVIPRGTLVIVNTGAANRIRRFTTNPTGSTSGGGPASGPCRRSAAGCICAWARTSPGWNSPKLWWR